MYKTHGFTRDHATPSLYSNDLNESADSSRWEDKENRNDASRWRQPKSKPQNKELTEEGKLTYRQKQIDYGKNTIGYDNYIRAVPVHKRDKRNPKLHPRTPDKRVENMSTKRFASHLRTWRKALHQYDDWSPPSTAATITIAKATHAERAPRTALGVARSASSALFPSNEKIPTVACTMVSALRMDLSAEKYFEEDEDEEDLDIVPMCMLPDLENMDEEGNVIVPADDKTDVTYKENVSAGTAESNNQNECNPNDSSCIFTSDSFYVEGLEDIY
ncbi:hypothetical protein, variant [Sphaeroforma arctica JP610]|uniref:Histone RNA hairpin-binding protein RNA-binding domain-containing protein n=1 Tax=Sphaeroforma arctica JP610 TaxID=667725 RepID=A0A0L0G6A1_9EUKA|nr:hypothetical protein, variant [Sphaeroforma arctica JP610]KNC83738.1 hypothetical protein, variant [Sphaeroforma arctica JP610]|eukprot:XP_014157640.1 hypothetical protein, variant [Sphaeroforma arctica JP610]